MGRCDVCRSHSQHFCFVHQVFVCDSCLLSPGSVHERCALGTYRRFVQDSSYSWPPCCPTCSQRLLVGGDNIRRMCLHLEHAACIENSPSPDRDCPLCKKPLLHSSGNDPLSQTIQKRFRNTFLKALEMLPTSTASRDTLKQWSKEDSAKASNTSTEHASLRIYETESGTASKVMSESSNINEEGGKISYGLTQQAPANDTQRTASRVSTTAAGTAVSHPENGASRFHVSLDLPVPKVDRKSRNLSYVKSGGVGHRSGSSTTVRKIAKLGNRRIMELKKLVSERRRHISIFVAFMTCIVLIALLMSGEDTLKAINKPIVEEVSLPNVRVNPAFLQAQSQGQQDRKQE